MSKLMTVIVFLISLARAGAAQSTDQAKLREVIKLPQLFVNVQFQLTKETVDPKVQIAALQKTLHGDPSDAATYVKFGDLYGDKPWNNEGKAHAAYLQAISLFRKQLAKQPHNGWVMAQLGTALYDANQFTEAEKRLREAVRVAPNDWRTWAELGDFVQNRSYSLAFGDSARFYISFDDIAALRQKLEPILSKKAPSEQIASLQKAENEAHVDFDRAVALKPDSPEPYTRRSSFLFLDKVAAQNFIQVAQGGTPDYAMVIPPEALEDTWKAASLLPDDPEKQAGTAIFELLASLQSGSDNLKADQPGVLDRLPPISRERIHVAMERLRKSVGDTDRHKAAIAAVALASLAIFNGDMVQAEAMAKRALTLNPNSKRAWDALCGVYVSTERFKDLVGALKSRIKQKDTPYNRLALAKAYEHLSDSTSASEQIRTAVARFPNDLLLNLAMVDTLMKRTDTDSLKQAGEWMAHAQALYARMSEEDKKVNQANMNLTRGVYLALIGKSAIAKEALQSVLAGDADNEEAKDVMAILDGSP